MLFVLMAVLLAPLLKADQPFYDRSHPSAVFGEARKYRIFLPASYTTSTARYPVIYYLHGHSDRYTLEKYDNGMDTVPKIAAFVASHEAIVVAPDGYVARDYTGFYGGTPYDVRREGGDYDYGAYFLELVQHIDSTYRTWTDRRHRATSGLSMGGFMSLYLSARFPERIGSASAFNPGPEFYTGEKGRRSLWRPKDHVLDHEHTSIRLVRASGDYISQYHEETRTAYAMAPTVDFEFRQDEYHRHWATSIGETFEFHTRAFVNPALDAVPVEWSYSTAFRNFSVWDYTVDSDSAKPAITYLEHVAQGGLRIRTRQWAPDGPAAVCESLRLTTAALYQPEAAYQALDFALATGKTRAMRLQADHDGRLTVSVDCSGHELSFTGPGAGGQPPVLLPLTSRDVFRTGPARPVSLPVRIFNPRGTPMNDVRAELSSAYPTVEVLRGRATTNQIGPGAAADLSADFQLRFTAADGDYQHARIDLMLTFDGDHQTRTPIDVLIAPDAMPPPPELAILDGRSKAFPVFRQAGNQGGGAAVERTVQEGSGNGNGILEPGEQATLWIRLAQGLDPFDKNNWCRAKVYSNSPWVTEIADIQEAKQREWTSAMGRTSLIALSPQVPGGTEIPLVLDCESWSFTFTPDVRYGKEPLFQAFQIHKHHLFAWTWRAGVRKQ